MSRSFASRNNPPRPIHARTTPDPFSVATARHPHKDLTLFAGGLPSSTIVSSEEIYDALAASSRIINGHVRIDEDEVMSKRPGSLGLYRSRDGRHTGRPEFAAW